MIELSHRAFAKAFLAAAAVTCIVGCAGQSATTTAAAPANTPVAAEVASSKSKMQCQTDAATGSMIRRNSVCVPDDMTGDVQRNTQETIRSYTQRQ